MKSVARWVVALKEREGILYGFLDDLKKYTKKIDQRLDQHEESMREFRSEFQEMQHKANARITQNEDMIRALHTLHGDLLRMRTLQREGLDDHERRLSGAGM